MTSPRPHDLMTRRFRSSLVPWFHDSMCPCPHDSTCSTDWKVSRLCLMGHLSAEHPSRIPFLLKASVVGRHKRFGGVVLVNPVFCVDNTCAIISCMVYILQYSSITESKGRMRPQHRRIELRFMVNKQAIYECFAAINSSAELMQGGEGLLALGFKGQCTSIPISAK